MADYATFVELQDKHRTAQVLGNMARVYAKLGNSEQALTNYRGRPQCSWGRGRGKLRPDAARDRGPAPAQRQRDAAAATFEMGLTTSNPTARQHDEAS